MPFGFAGQDYDIPQTLNYSLWVALAPWFFGARVLFNAKIGQNFSAKMESWTRIQNNFRKHFFQNFTKTYIEVKMWTKSWFFYIVIKFGLQLWHFQAHNWKSYYIVPPEGRDLISFKKNPKGEKKSALEFRLRLRLRLTIILHTF